MSVLELQEIDPQLRPACDLAMTRDHLAKGLSHPHFSIEGFEVAVADYLNALQVFHFGSEARPHFASYVDVAAVVKTEMYYLTGKHDYCVVDIEQDIVKYCDDERAQWLRENEYPVLPRAVSMTMLNILDGNRQF